MRRSHTTRCQRNFGFGASSCSWGSLLSSSWQLLGLISAFVVFAHAHKHVPDACRVGLHTTDCASGGTCECFRACERMHWFSGPSYCHNVSLPDTFTELLNAPAVSYLYERPVASGGFNIGETNDGRGGTGEPHAWETYKAPESCNYNGWVVNGQCSCFFDWEGATCDVRVRRDQVCLGAPCENCVEGVCEDPPRARNATRSPAVYVYPLPPGFNQLRPRIAMERNLPYEFWRRLSRSEHETTDPANADLFFVPVSAMGVVSHGVVLLALRYVAETWPYFNASSGANHVVLCPWDFGCSWLSGYPEVARVRFVTHWGLTKKSSVYANDCLLCGPSYVPSKDIVAPDMMEGVFKFAAPQTVPRTTLLFFSGSQSTILRTRIFQSTLRSQPGANCSPKPTKLAHLSFSVQFVCLCLKTLAPSVPRVRWLDAVEARHRIWRCRSILFSISNGYFLDKKKWKQEFTCGVTTTPVYRHCTRRLCLLRLLLYIICSVSDWNVDIGKHIH